jgi:hypothetical protein
MSGFNSEIDGSGGHDGPKRGHSCCGFMCDMRRAVIITNIISIVAVILTAIAVSVVYHAAKNSNDPASQDSVHALETRAFRMQIALTVFGIFFAFGAIFGALKYKVIPVAANAVFIFVSFVISAALQNKAARESNNYSYGPVNIIFSLVANALFMYPHIVYCREVKAGILSAETYSSREKQSCCCV